MMFFPFVLLSFLSLGLSAPLTDCDTVLKPKNITNGELLGRWHFIAGSSDDIETRSILNGFGYILWELNVTSQSNILKLFQTVEGESSSSTYDVNFENGTVFTEPPYLKELSLMTKCTNCLVGHEEVISGKYVTTNLLIFSKRRRVSRSVKKILENYATCLGMLPPIFYSP